MTIQRCFLGFLIFLFTEPVLSQDSTNFCPVVDQWQILITAKAKEKKSDSHISVFKDFINRELNQSKSVGKVKGIVFPNPKSMGMNGSKPKYSLLILITYSSKGNSNQEHQEFAESEIKRMFELFKSQRKVSYEKLEIDTFSASKIELEG